MNQLIQAEPFIIHQARWVVPMAGPVLMDGAVAVRGERIAAVGPAAELRLSLGSQMSRHYDHGHGAIIPALVNAHTHLEFTALGGAIPPQANLPAWLQAAISAFSALPGEKIEQGIRDALAAMHRFGTGLVGEVSNTGRSLPLLAAGSLEFHYFYECLGFNLLHDGPLEADFPFLATANSASSPVSAAAHATYSVSAPLLGRIRDWNRRQGRPAGIHLAESREELAFLARGGGALQELLARRGRMYDGYTPPGCSPTIYLDRLGFWDEPTLAVHGVWLDAADREILARRGVWLALCPRSNRHTGAGFPDVPGLLRAGLKLALGTDSLASNRDFNLFNEIKVIHERYPDLEILELLTMATLHGAQALGRGLDLGSLQPGKLAALLFLPLPPGEPFPQSLLQAGGEGNIHWLTNHGKEMSHGA